VHQSGTAHLGASRYPKTPDSKHLQFKNSQQGKCASVKHDPFGASNYQKTSSSKHLQLKNSKQGQFKVVRENNGYCVQCTLPIYLPFSKTFKKKIRGTTPLAGYHPIHQIWACANLFGTLIYSTHKISFFWWQYLKQKFSKYKNFFYIFWKSVNNKHTFFEFMSNWKRTSASASRTVTLRKRNMARHCGEDLCFEQDAVIQKNHRRKSSKSSLSWKPEKVT